MSFVWSNVSSGTIGVTTHVNEAKDNIDTLADNLGASHYSWSEMPVSQDEFVGQSQIQELQDATDYIDTVNVCSAEKAGYDTTINASDDSTIYSSKDTSIDSSKDVTIDTTKHNSVDTNQNTGIYSTKNNSILSDQNTTVDNDQHATYYGTQNSYVLTVNYNNDYSGPGA